MGKVKKVKQEGQPNFFVLNVEKMVLGVVLLLFGVLVFTGYSLESLPSDRTPDKLVASAKQAKQAVSNPDNWKGIESTLVVPTGFQKRLNLQQISSTVYELDKPFEPKNMQVGQRRQDPTLFAPEKVEAMAITGPLAYMLQRGEKDPFLDDPNSEHEKKEVKAPPKRRNKMDPYGGDEYGSGSSGGRGMSSGGAGYGAMPGMSGSGSGMSMPGSGMGMGMPGSGMGMSEDGSALGPVIMADPQYRTGFRAGMGAIAKSETCVAVKALIPWKKQWDEYEMKFMDALGFNPARDQPRFLSFTAERAEVTDDPNAELAWEQLTWTQKCIGELQTSGWAGLPQDVADPRYTFPFVLTMPVPPFIDRDLDKLALHSEIPKMKPQLPPTLTEQEKMIEEAKAKAKAKKAAEKPTDVPTLPGAAGATGGMQGMAGMESGGMPGMGMPGMGMSGMPGMGMPGAEGGMPGMGMGMPGMEGMGMSGMSGMPGMGGSGYGGMSSYGGSGSGMSMPGMEGSGGMGMGMGMGGSGGYDPSGMGMTIARGPQVPHLMIRFFDFTAEAGKKYRYRVQVLLEDPNHPMDARWEPTERYFEDDVKKRLAKQITEERTNKKAPRKYYRRTEFSEPSEIVSVEIKPETHVSKIAAGKFTLIKDPGTNVKDVGAHILFQTDEPTGKVMAVVWDSQRAVDVPGVIDGYRGTCLNFKAKADVIHPITMVYKALPDYDVQTDHVLADIRGGELLPVVDKNDKGEPLLTIGEYAYFDELGQLHVGDELSDLADFRKLAMPELPPAAAGSMGMGMEGEPSAEMGMGMPGSEGMGDPRSKRGKKKG